MLHYAIVFFILSTISILDLEIPLLEHVHPKAKILFLIFIGLFQDRYSNIAVKNTPHPFYS